MKIGFHGAAQTVTGSRHLLHINGRRLLLDCGLYQGRRKEAYDRNRTFPFRADQIDAVILSHAHIDHSGNLPNMMRNGYTGPIHATKPTAQLSALMIRDSGSIQESDAAPAGLAADAPTRTGSLAETTRAETSAAISTCACS